MLQTAKHPSLALILDEAIGNHPAAPSRPDTGTAASPLLPSAEEFGLSEIMQGEGLFKPWNGHAPHASSASLLFVSDPREVLGVHLQPTARGPAPSLHSPYIRLCNALETFVDEATEHDDNFLMSRHEDDCEAPTETRRSGILSIGTSSVATSSYIMSPSSANDKSAASGASSGGNAISASRSLWLGSVDPTVTEQDIRQFFGPFGAIETIRMLPAQECAFVNYYSIEDAIRAKAAMQGITLGNLVLKIGFGKIDALTASGSSIGGAPGSNPYGAGGSTTANGETISRSVWIGNIGPEVTAETIMERFNGFGPIESCRILDMKNCAFVNFYTTDAAIAAKTTMNGTIIEGHAIKTGYAKDSSMMRSFSNIEHLPMNHVPAMDASSHHLSMNNGMPGSGDQHSSHPAYNGIYASSAPSSSAAPAVNFLSMMQKMSVPAAARRPTEPPEGSHITASHPSVYAYDGGLLREYRRAVETSPSTEIERVLHLLEPVLVDVSVDGYGNILMQKIIEKASEPLQCWILDRIEQKIAAIGMNKNGTWVIQKFISQGKSEAILRRVLSAIKEDVIAMLEDQYGNYVVQAAIPVAHLLDEKENFIFNCITENALRLAMGRFSSRALKSVLEQAAPPLEQRQVAKALLPHASLLCQDQNGAVVIQWYLDSDIPGKLGQLVEKIRGQIAQIVLNKQGGAVIARIVSSADETQARDQVILELFEIVGAEASSSKSKTSVTMRLSATAKESNDLATAPFESQLGALLREPTTCSILLKAYNMSKPALRPRLADSMRPHLLKTIAASLHVDNSSPEFLASRQSEFPTHLIKLFQELIVSKSNQIPQ